MKKKIVFLRHAKSNWDNPLLDDFDRPLSKKGVRDALLMKPLIKKYIKNIDFFFSSSSKRTRETVKYIFPNEKKTFSFSKSLYLAEKELIIEMLASLDSKKKIALVVGHNPGLHEVVQKLSNQTMQKFPTCALAIVSFNSDWKQLRKETGCLELFIKPSDFR